MKKKIMLACMLVYVGLCFLGCGKSTFDTVKANMSEWTKVYYFGENESFYCSLSSGEREKTYLYNGKSEENVEFSLLNLTFANQSSKNVIKVKVSIDGTESEKEMELNTLNSTYMVDFEKTFKGTESIVVTYDNVSLTLENLSKDFVINDSKALEIASYELKDKITEKKSFNALNAECYLRVLDKKANDFDGVFWCFTVINTDNKNYSIIISTKDGSILAKSN